MTDVQITIDDELQLPNDPPAKIWRVLVLARAGFACERCGAKGVRLTGHHKDGNDANNCLANGECLCGKCHYHEHKRDVISGRWGDPDD